MLRSSNPALREGVFTQFKNHDLPRGGIGGETITLQPRTMTIAGTVNATFILLGLCCAFAVLSWGMLRPALVAVQQGAAAKPGPMVLIATFGAMIVGLILAIAIGFKPKLAPWLAPLYAIVQGVLVGAISVMTAVMWPNGAGLVLMAAILTFGILFTLLAIYRTGLIKPSENFKLGLSAATGGVFLLLMGWMVIRMIFPSTPGMEQLGWIGVGISGFVVVLASMNLVMDFDFIEEGAKANAPKYMEWYAAFGLMVTLIWLYLELLRLLRLISAQRN
jgi:uncharacterized YccA/Bax inhibitor family protein